MIDNKEDIPFPDEVEYLAEINRKLSSSMENANANVERMDKDYMDAKRYMVHNRGEIDPHEMFQNELQLKQIDHQGAISVETRDKLAKLLDSPYFARIDILQQELSQTSDEKMKSIIASIQKEQNQIVRNEKSGTMIIQGVAGSGKTSIALHRIAFLLYRFKDRLSAKNVTILSPNKVFGDYISNVLPELGEEPIYEISFSDIASIKMHKKN